MRVSLTLLLLALLVAVSFASRYDGNTPYGTNLAHKVQKLKNHIASAHKHIFHKLRLRLQRRKKLLIRKRPRKPSKPTKPSKPSKPDCKSPKMRGPGKARIPRWFFNPASCKCERFIYGGCRGNRNNYKTKQECERKCDHPTGPDCTSPKETGPCKAYFRRWYYNSAKKRCEKFVYGGCQGNGNNYKTKEECEKTCGAPVPPKCTDDTCTKKDEVCVEVRGVPTCFVRPRCKKDTCPKDQVCVLIKVQCITAPCFDQPTCVGPPACKPDTCPKKDQGCVLKKIEPCTTTPCLPQPTCVDLPSCKDHKCTKPGQVCVLEKVRCPTTPCFPQPKCVVPPSCKADTCPRKDQACVLKKSESCETIPCLPQPTCVDLPSCKDHKCTKPGEVCVLKKVQCPTTPCFPQPTCVVPPSCKADSCPRKDQACILKKSEPCETIPCLPQPTCVDRPTCKDVKCNKKFNEVCKMVNNCGPFGPCILPRPECIPTCEGYNKCTKGKTHCELRPVKNPLLECQADAPCFPRPECIPDPPTCEAHPTCPEGTHCILKATPCAPETYPCYPQPTCVPDPTCENNKCTDGQYCAIEKVCGKKSCVPKQVCKTPLTCKTVRCSKGYTCQIFQCPCKFPPCRSFPQCVAKLGVVPCPSGKPVGYCKHCSCPSKESTCVKGKCCKNCGPPFKLPVSDCIDGCCPKGSHCNGGMCCPFVKG